MLELVHDVQIPVLAAKQELRVAGGEAHKGTGIDRDVDRDFRSPLAAEAGSPGTSERRWEAYNAKRKAEDIPHTHTDIHAAEGVGARPTAVER